MIVLVMSCLSQLLRGMIDEVGNLRWLSKMFTFDAACEEDEVATMNAGTSEAVAQLRRSGRSRGRPFRSVFPTEEDSPSSKHHLHLSSESMLDEHDHVHDTQSYHVSHMDLNAQID